MDNATQLKRIFSLLATDKNVSPDLQRILLDQEERRHESHIESKHDAIWEARAVERVEDQPKERRA